MLLEVRDITLVERLKKLSHRPDAPLDDVLKRLLEKDRHIVIAEAIGREIGNQLVDALSKNLAKASAEAMRSVSREVLRDTLREVMSELTKDLAKHISEGVADVIMSRSITGEARWDLVMLVASKKKCLRFSDIVMLLGKLTNSTELKKRGFEPVGRDKARMWCLKEEVDKLR